MKVSKYPIAIVADYITIAMPVDAQILTVQMQNNVACIWALVDPDAPLIERRFRWAGTGHEIKEDIKDLWYIGTFQLFEIIS